MNNYTNLSHATSILDLVTYGNTFTGGYLTIFLFIATAVITFITLKNNYPINVSFAVSAYIISVIALLFRIIGWIPDKFMFICFVLAGIGPVILFLSK